MSIIITFQGIYYDFVRSYIDHDDLVVTEAPTNSFEISLACGSALILFN